jgi:hypothetical protein
LSRAFSDKPDGGTPLTSPNQLFPPPQLKDKPYVEFTEEAKDWYTFGVVQSQIDGGLPDEPGPKSMKQKSLEVDPDEKPFNQIYEGNDDEGNFTKVEAISDPAVWYWVERLIPKPGSNVAPKITPSGPTSTGWINRPATAPDRTYFIPRTRSNLFPVYKEIEGDEFHKELDGFSYTGSPRMQPILKPPFMRKDATSFKTLTTIHHVEGDLRDFERDLRTYLESKYGTKILTACLEGYGRVKLKGNFVEDTANWLKEQGF